MKNIPFSPPDISEKEINSVVEVLKSGWITTGPKTKEFEKRIAEYCNTEKAVCLNSATACMEMTLRVLGVGKGDEVIVPAYTYTATASVVTHVGATLKMVDLEKNTFRFDYTKLENAITEKTKVIIPVDLGGVMFEYDRLFEIVNRKRGLFKPNNSVQKAFGRVIIMADAAHSFGAEYKGKKSGEVADFTSFSFHAVKNLTTAEGGAVTWKNIDGVCNDQLYKQYQLLSLHGQNKDALAKTKIGSWEYDIVAPNYKCNMTDIHAAIGLAQLDRYNSILKKRKQIVEIYNNAFLNSPKFSVLQHFDQNHNSSCHLYLLRISGFTAENRNEFIEQMAKRGIATNVHYKPLPLLTAYKNLGFNITNYPNALDMFKNEVTLPLNTVMSVEDAQYVANTVLEIIG